MKKEDEPWSLQSFAAVRHDRLEFTHDAFGVLVEHPDVPGAQVYVVAHGSEAKRLARDTFVRRFGSHEPNTSVLLDGSSRAERVHGDDVVRGLAALGWTRSNIAGRPRIFGHAKTRRQMCLSWEDHDVIPPIALGGIARAAGVPLASFEEAIGLGAVRAIDAQRARLIEDTKRRQEAERRQQEAAEFAERTRQKAAKAAEVAAEAQRNAEAAAAAATRLGGDAA